jgi:hypothetical protein
MLEYRFASGRRRVAEALIFAKNIHLRNLSLKRSRSSDKGALPPARLERAAARFSRAVYTKRRFCRVRPKFVPSGRNFARRQKHFNFASSDQICVVRSNSCFVQMPLKWRRANLGSGSPNEIAAGNRNHDFRRGRKLNSALWQRSRNLR